MGCSLQALHGDCGFMAANLYARSIFGEDALANLSIERSTNQPDSTVTGHIRIRAKSQVSLLCETALSLVHGNVCNNLE